MSTENQGQAPKQKVQISVSAVQADLSRGMTRKEIAQKYGLKGKAIKQLFERPALKGLRTKKTLETEFEIIDDVPEDQIKTKIGKEALAKKNEGATAATVNESTETVSESVATTPVVPAEVSGEIKEVSTEQDKIQEAPEHVTTKKGVW